MSLSKEIKAHIAAHGPISVADYMRQAGAYYYAHHEPFGTEGDFITAPEISQIFGELIGAWLAQLWQQMGAPHPCALAELGPGRGTLMQDILRATKKVPGFHSACSVHLIENSDRLRKLQQFRLTGMHPHLFWHADVADIPAYPLLLVANEFFDALPVHQYIKTHAGWTERMIGLNDKGELSFSFSVHSLPETKPLPLSVKEGAVMETCPQAETIVSALAQHVRRCRGGALIIDYGYTHNTGDTLQSIYQQRYSPVLEHPGDADITAHVNFAALAYAANEAIVHGPVTQDAFLSRLGIELRAEALLKHANDSQKEAVVYGVRRLRDAEAMGRLFKVLAITSPGLTPAAFN